jgi:hypothetical protein
MAKTNSFSLQHLMHLSDFWQMLPLFNEKLMGLRRLAVPLRVGWRMRAGETKGGTDPACRVS